MADALARHDAILRDAIRPQGHSRQDDRRRDDGRLPDGERRSRASIAALRRWPKSAGGDRPHCAWRSAAVMPSGAATLLRADDPSDRPHGRRQWRPRSCCRPSPPLIDRLPDSASLRDLGSTGSRTSAAPSWCSRWSIRPQASFPPWPHDNAASLPVPTGAFVGGAGSRRWATPGRPVDPPLTLTGLAGRARRAWASGPRRPGGPVPRWGRSSTCRPPATPRPCSWHSAAGRRGRGA